MGNREQLLDAAKQCLFDKGYERTTVRDISELAGVSKAAIGYHFGSKEALLNTALFAVLGDGEAGPAPVAELPPGERVAGLWTDLIRSFADNRTFWLANLESVLVAQRDPQVREQLAGGLQQGRSGITAELTGEPEESLPADAVRTLGSVQMALMGGLLMQHLTAPEQAPDATEVLKGIKALAALIPD